MRRSQSKCYHKEGYEDDSDEFDNVEEERRRNSIMKEIDGMLDSRSSSRVGATVMGAMDITENNKQSPSTKKMMHNTVVNSSNAVANGPFKSAKHQLINQNSSFIGSFLDMPSANAQSLGR